MRKVILSPVCALIVGISFQANSQEPEICRAETTQQEAAQKQLQGVSEQEEPAPPKPQACVGGVVRWDRTEVSLDVPEVKMGRKNYSMHVPETRMENKEYSIKEPVVTCEDKKVTQKPEAHCEDTWIETKTPFGTVKTKGVPKCTIKWTDVIAKICWPETRDKKVVLGIPQFKMNHRQFSYDVPEVTMKTKKIALHLPQFYVESGCVGPDCAEKCKTETEAKVNEVNQRRLARMAPAKQGMLAATSNLFQCQTRNLDEQRKLISSEYDKYITVAEATLAAMRAQGMLEAATQQEQELTKMKAERLTALQSIDKAKNELQSSERTALESLS